MVVFFLCLSRDSACGVGFCLVFFFVVCFWFFVFLGCGFNWVSTVVVVVYVWLFFVWVFVVWWVFFVVTDRFCLEIVLLG